MTRSISWISPSEAPFEEHNSSTNCCERYRARGYADGRLASWPSSARVTVLPPPHVNVTLALLISVRARTKNEGLIFSSAFQAAEAIASQPAAITSVKAVFPDPRAPMIATSPGLRGIVGVTAQDASVISTCDITWDGMAR